MILCFSSPVKMVVILAPHLCTFGGRFISDREVYWSPKVLVLSSLCKIALRLSFLILPLLIVLTSVSGSSLLSWNLSDAAGCGECHFWTLKPANSVNCLGGRWAISPGLSSGISYKERMNFSCCRYWALSRSYQGPAIWLTPWLW